MGMEDSKEQGCPIRLLMNWKRGAWVGRGLLTGKSWVRATGHGRAGCLAGRGGGQLCRQERGGPCLPRLSPWPVPSSPAPGSSSSSDRAPSPGKAAPLGTPSLSRASQPRPWAGFLLRAGKEGRRGPGGGGRNVTAGAGPAWKGLRQDAGGSGGRLGQNRRDASPHLGPSAQTFLPPFPARLASAACKVPRD